MPINTEMPPWLQRNLAPVSHDTPWVTQALQVGANIARQRAMLPLQVQEMNNKIQSDQLAIEHQRMDNEATRAEMIDEALDQEVYKSAIVGAKQNPTGALGMPDPGFKSAKYRKIWHDQQLADSMTGAGIAYKQQIIEQNKNVADAYRETPNAPLIKPNPDGTYDPQEYQKLMDAWAKERARKEELRYGWRWDYDENGELVPVRPGGSAWSSGPVRPEVQIYNGKPFLVNPKTGASHPLDNLPGDARAEISTLIKSNDKINEQLLQLPAVGKGTNADQDKRSRLLAARLANSARIAEIRKGVESPNTPAAPSSTAPTTPTKPTSPPDLKLGQHVWQNGVEYIYQGGPMNDASSFVPAR